jgi:hypothetical protein
MSLAELRPSIHALPRAEKFRLMQELISDLAHADDSQPIECPVWSPYEAEDAAVALLSLLDRDRAEAR